jgi:hypothetical protein
MRTLECPQDILHPTCGSDRILERSRYCSCSDIDPFSALESSLLLQYFSGRLVHMNTFLNPSLETNLPSLQTRQQKSGANGLSM